MQDNHSSSLMLQFSAQVNTCLYHLDMIRQAVVKKRWENLSHTIKHYTHEMNQLENICKHFKALPKKCIHTFQHLLRQQRRIMRMIHQAQQQTQSNILTTNQGLSRTKKLSHILEQL